MAEIKNYNCKILVHSSETALNANDRELLAAAREAASRAYAPYSGFNVGAAVLLENGKTVTGNNQENAAYPSGLCAERVALFYASSEYPGIKIKAIAVSASSKNRKLSEPVPPCGSCRQVMSEYEQKSGSAIRIMMAGEAGEVYECESISQLLPLSFGAKDL